MPPLVSQQRPHEAPARGPLGAAWSHPPRTSHSLQHAAPCPCHAPRASWAAVGAARRRHARSVQRTHTTGARPAAVTEALKLQTKLREEAKRRTMTPKQRENARRTALYSTSASQLQRTRKAKKQSPAVRTARWLTGEREPERKNPHERIEERLAAHRLKHSQPWRPLRVKTCVARSIDSRRHRHTREAHKRSRARRRGPRRLQHHARAGRRDELAPRGRGCGAAGVAAAAAGQPARVARLDNRHAGAREDAERE